MVSERELQAVYQRGDGKWVATIKQGPLVEHYELHRVAGHPMKDEEEARAVAHGLIEKGGYG